jgi:hypothetical protein
LRKLRGITIKNAQILETPAVLTSADWITAPDWTPTEPATPAEWASVVTLVSTPASTPEAPWSQNPTELPTSSQTTTPSQTLPQQEISSSWPQEISDNSIPLDRISEVESLPVLIDFGNWEKEIISIGWGNKWKDIYIWEKKFTIKMIAWVTDFDKSDIFSELEFKGGKLIIRTSSVIIKEIHYEGEQFKKFTSEFASLRDLEINKSLPSKTKSQMGYSVTSTITRIA